MFVVEGPTSCPPFPPSTLPFSFIPVFIIILITRSQMMTISLELHNYICVTMPLGTALNVPMSYAVHLLNSKGPAKAASEKARTHPGRQ
jgi:hypothetical protein